MMDEMVLRNALLEMQEYLVSQLPEPDTEDEKLPLGFRRRVKRLIEKHDQPIWYYLKNSVAAMILVFALLGGALLGINERVRADVWEWIRERLPIFARDAIEITLVEDYHPYTMDYSEEGIFYYVLKRNETFVYDFYFQPYSGRQNDTCLIHREGGYMKDLSAVKKKDGRHYCILWVDDAAGYLSEYDSEGRPCRELTLKGYGFEIPGMFPSLLALPEGGYLIGLMDKVYFVGEDGALEHIVSVGEDSQIRNMVAMENGRRFAVYQDLIGSGMKVAELDPEGEAVIATRNLPVFEERISVHEGNKLVYCANDAAYLFDMDEAGDEMLIDFKEHNLVATQIEGIYDNGSYLLLVSVDEPEGKKRIRVFRLNKRAEKEFIAISAGKSESDIEAEESESGGGMGNGENEEESDYGLGNGEGGKGRRILRVAVSADIENAWVIEYRARKYSQESASVVVEVEKFDGTSKEYLESLERSAGILEEGLSDKERRPDIVVLPDHTDIEPLVKLGLLADLNPLCEKQDQYSIDDLLPKAREALSVGNGLYALGKTFRLLLRSSDGTEYHAYEKEHDAEKMEGLEDGKEHDAEEIKRLEDRKEHDAERTEHQEEMWEHGLSRMVHPTGQTCTAVEYLDWYDAYLDKEGVTGMPDLEQFFFAVLPDFYNEGEKTAEFQSLEFQELMKTYRSLRMKHAGEWVPFDAKYDLDLRIANKFVAGPAWVGEFLSEIQLLNPDIRLSGIPTRRGAQATYMKIEHPLTILESSECKEEALDFILYACTTKTHEYQTVGGLTNESEDGDMQTKGTFWVFENYLKEDIWETEKSNCWSMWFVQPTPGMRFYGNGIEGEITQEHKEMLRELMDSAEVVTKTQSDVYEMFLEEMDGYFHGNKDLDSCCDILQNRVSLYLAE